MCMARWGLGNHSLVALPLVDTCLQQWQFRCSEPVGRNIIYLSDCVELLLAPTPATYVIQAIHHAFAKKRGLAQD